MGWDNSFQTIIVLPTGATSGSRIVLDGESGLILIYDADNNLIASISPDDTTDAAGNTILQGITDYVGSEYVQMDVGNLYLGVLPDPANPAFVPVPGLLGIKGDSSSIGLQSAANQDLPDSSFLECVSGVLAAGTGHDTYPHHQVNGDIWVVVDALQGGNPHNNNALIAAPVPLGQSFPVAETWHDVTLGTGWATGPGISGSYPPLQFRRDGLDNVHLFGTFHATSTTPSTIIGTGLIGVNLATLGGVSVIGPAQRMVSTGGAIPMYAENTGAIRSAALPTPIAVNDTFMINQSYPLGNIP
jgi:hypothetical protein